MAEDQAARRFFFILLATATVLLAAVISPIASPLFMAAVFAGVLWPLQTRLARMLRGAKGLSAGILVVAVARVVVHHVK